MTSESIAMRIKLLEARRQEKMQEQKAQLARRKATKLQRQNTRHMG
jgi:hypothetical protein